MADLARSGPALRQMGAWGVGFIAFNSMIGAGIFGLPGKLDAALGGFAPWLVLGAGLAVMLMALCYADLATRFDQNGGPQLFATAAFGNFTGFQVGWIYWAGRVTGSAANASVLAAYATIFAPGVPASSIAVTAIALVTLLNLASLNRAVSALGLLSLFKLVPLLVVCVAALMLFGAPQPAALPSLGSTGSVALVALYAFLGFEAATLPAGETRDPKRTVPRALIVTLALVTTIYVLVQLAYSGAALGASDKPLADLANLAIGPWGSLLIAATVLVSVFANVSCALTAAPRLTAAMADQGQLPDVFGRRSSTGSPFASVLIYGAVAIALAASGSFVFLAVVGTLARLFAYAMCALAIPVLDHRSDAPMRWVRGVMVPAAVLIFCLWAASQSQQHEWLTFVGYFVAGTLLFGLSQVSKRH